MYGAKIESSRVESGGATISSRNSFINVNDDLVHFVGKTVFMVLWKEHSASVIFTCHFAHHWYFLVVFARKMCHQTSTKGKFVGGCTS